jgi:hypothetical protein
VTPQQRQFFARARRRVAHMQPELRTAWLQTIQNVQEVVDDSKVAKIVASGDVDALFTELLTDPVLDRAALPLRQAIRNSTQTGFRYAVSDLPGAGKIDGMLAVAFDHLSPTVIDAVRSLETDALNTIKKSVKETVRAFVENGLRDGTPYREIARELRPTIGLAPNQAAAVRSFQRLLKGGDPAALERALRDRRFDATLARALGKDGTGLSAAQIKTMTDAYRRKFVAFNANVNVKQTTMDSYRVGQRLAWDNAKDAGVIPEGFETTKTWVHMDPQPNPRPEHQALNGETVAADQPYSTGQMSAGEGDYGCHCVDRFGVRRIASAA